MAEQLLVPLDTYLKVGVHIGTKFKTKYMEQFIYRIRPDGLAVLNVQKIDERMNLAIKFLCKYNKEDILIVGRRENGLDAVKLFSKLTGIRCFAGRYPPGILTNPNLENFIEAKVLLVTDPWPDRNAVFDAIKCGMPVVALCDTNNESNFVDIVVPCNNKGKKSLGLFFYLFAREFLKTKCLIKSEEEMSVKLDKFIEE